MAAARQSRRVAVQATVVLALALTLAAAVACVNADSATTSSGISSGSVAEAAGAKVRELLRWLIQYPQSYSVWWLKLAEESPWHVGIETSLIVFIVYVLLFKKEYDPKKKGFGGRDPEELTEAEIDELVEEWKPEPLVPPQTALEADMWASRPIVDHCEGPKHVALAGAEGTAVLNLASSDYLGLGRR